MGLRDVPCVVGSDGTVSIVKIVFLSPRVENLKVKKVIKSFVPEPSESSVFRVFRDSYACERSPHPYIRIFYISVYFTCS